MKKKFLLIIVAIGLFLLIPVSMASAASSQGSGVTDISGVVTHNSSPITGANVTVVCNSYNGTSSTDNTGTYLVVFSSAKCPNGDTAYVTATSGVLGGVNNGPVNALTARLNVSIVNVSLVPELGIVTGFSATIIGGGTFLYIRHRNLSVKKA